MLATIMDSALDSDDLELIDFEEEIACDTDECENAAEYRVRLSCCGYLILPCEDCLIESKNWLKRQIGKTLICGICNARTPAGPEWFIVIGKL